MLSPRLYRNSLLTIVGAGLIAAAVAFWWPPPALPEWRGVDFGLDGTSASVFAPDKLLVFELDLKPGDLKRMQDHAADELTVPASLKVGAADVGAVGLRYKGSTGTLTQVLAERRTESYMPKLSLKIVFDHKVDERRFCGMRRLNFHSMIYDESLMRDRLCYQAFREAGIAAPRCSHAMIVINGKNVGLYAMVEQIDEAFVVDRFADRAGGVLYKEVWPLHRGAKKYEEEARANPNNRTHEAMIRLANNLREAEEAQLPGALAKAADLDDLLRYMIVDQALKNWDGVRGWTSAKEQGPNWNHNYYWYVDPSERLTLIPWDLDSTLRHPARRDELPPWYDLGELTGRGTSTGNGWFAWPAGEDRLIRAISIHARGRYAKVARELLDGPLALEHMLQSIDTWRDQVRPYVAHDPFLGSLWAWDAGLESLRNDLHAIAGWMDQEVQNWNDVLPPRLRQN